MKDPDGGEKVEKGTEITLTVAKEAAKATVPDLTGSTVSEVRKLLAEQNLKLGSTTEVESSAGSGTVVEQSTASGEEGWGRRGSGRTASSSSPCRSGTVSARARCLKGESGFGP